MSENNQFLEEKQQNDEYFQDKTLLKIFLKNEKDLSDMDELFCQQYLEKLSSFGLSRLTSESTHLEDEREQLLTQIQDLAYNNYQTFIQAAACTKDIFRDFNVIEKHVDSLTENVPSFSDKVEHFAKESQDINLRRKQNSLVLSHHTQLLEILEIPQLMDTCVRNGYYEEALDLSSFVKRLGKKFSNIQIIADIHHEVNRCMQYMLNQLLQQLRGHVQLPACLRIISYIRQLAVFKEPELRITFLQARDSWFKSLLMQIPSDDAYQHLSKVIETCRVNLFDIITQYKAIFSDDEHTFTLDQDKSTNYTHILNSWVIKKISSFIETLKVDLNRNIAGRLDSIYAQCMYFGLSFSRIGTDFRGLLIPIFQKFAWAQFEHTLKKSTSRFEDDINTFSLTSKNLPRRNVNPKQKYVSNDPSNPPQELLVFPSIAIYLNGVLTAFNNLRQFPATSFVHNVKEALCRSLDKVIMALQNWARLESQSQPDKIKDDVRYYCLIVCRYFLPYIKIVFESFFNSVNLQNMIGRLPANEIGQKIKASSSIQPDNYFKILKDFVDINELYEILEAEQSEKKTENDSETENLSPSLETPMKISNQGISEHKTTGKIMDNIEVPDNVEASNGLEK